MKLKMKETNQLSKIVTFNISGKIFQCFTSTLTKYNSLLSNIISENSSKLKDKDGSIFLNQDPNGFEFILNCLRQNLFNISIKEKEKFSFLENEIKFYGLDYLIKINLAPEKQEKQEKMKKKIKKKVRGKGKSKKAPRAMAPPPAVAVAPAIVPIPFVKRTIPYFHRYLFNYNSFFVKNLIYFEDFMLGFFSFSILLTAIQLQFAYFGMIPFSIPFLGLKYFIGFGVMAFFIYQTILEYDQYKAGGFFGFEWFFAFPLSVTFAYSLYLLECRIQSFYFQETTNWFWPIYTFSNFETLKIVLYTAFFLGIMLVVIFEQGLIHYRSNSFLQFLKSDLIIYTIPFTLIYCLTVLMIHLNSSSRYPVTLWTYFPISILHEIFGVWLFQTNPIYKEEKRIRTILVYLIVFKTSLLFGFRWIWIFFLVAAEISLKMKEMASL
jgi:hypothetical protein